MTGIDKDALEAAGEAIFQRCNYFNDYVLETIGKRIKKIGQLSAYDEQTLKNMADISGDMKAITKKLAEITGQNINDIEKIYTQVMTDGVNSYKPLYDFKGMRFVPFEENEFAKQLTEHWFKETAGTMINLSRTKAIGFDKYNLSGDVIGHTPLEGAFQKAIDDAVVAVSSNTVDFSSAMRETIKSLGGSGVKVTYGSGVNRLLGAMVRQNLLYGAKQTAIAYDERISMELGCDGFEVEAHPGCRPSHEFMQGQMYSNSGRVVIDGITYEDGSEALARLNDYGCWHSKIGVILGVSEPRYSKEELERIHRETSERIEYEGREKTLYEWKQTQRRIEREVRKESQTRDMARAAGMNSLANDCDYKIKIYREKYDDMCERIGLEPRLNRMQTYSGKSLTSSGGGGIIKVQGGKNMHINSIDSPIEQRNTAKGNPNAILQIGRPLNNRQQKILDTLSEYDSRIVVKKKNVNMKDLSAMTAITGDEFAMFTKGSDRLIIHGNATQVNIDVKQAMELSKQGYKWSGHTHPGIGWNCLQASEGDVEILKCFKQKVAYIYNSQGLYLEFEKE